MGPTTKFAAKRKQYQQAQDAMRSSENIVKGIRRELALHIKEKQAELAKLFPTETMNTPRAFDVFPDPGGRNAAADKPFAVLVTGYKNWHTITPKEVKEVIRIMKEDGWHHASTTDGPHTWTIRFD